MDEKGWLDMDKLMKNADTAGNTQRIRALRHGRKIQAQVRLLQELKVSHKDMALMDPAKYDRMVHSHCDFLWSNYMMIFNRLLRDEIDVDILNRFIETLIQVEDGEMDEFDASVKVGGILKELYLDSAIKRKEKQEDKDKLLQAAEAGKKRRPARDISWSQFKTVS
jgi:hypothetical protein